MKKTYKKPQICFFPNMGNIQEDHLFLLSDEKLTQYIQTSKEVEYTKVYKANPNIIMREVDGDCILIPTSNDVAINGLITLNPIAQFLWKQFQTPSTIPEVLAKAREKYDDEDGCMEQDIRGFVNGYVRINFIMEE
ncbi:PqqD family protein [Phocaeicola coprocola]|jgi:hypothetical protein|uniref:PqqD family protein n=1 Tax=Phocaeicola coprocola TaxID=310298 RepID=UPI0032C1ED00